MSPAWTWTIISAAAALVAAWGFLDAWSDRRALANRRNGRRRIANGYMRAEVIRLAIGIGWTWIGASAIASGSASSWSLIVLILVGANAGMLINSILDARDRIAVRRTAYPPLPQEAAE